MPRVKVKAKQGWTKMNEFLAELDAAGWRIVSGVWGQPGNGFEIEVVKQEGPTVLSEVSLPSFTMEEV